MSELYTIKYPLNWRGYFIEGAGLVGLSQDAFFLKRTNRLSTQGHRDFLAINFKSLLLKVRLEDALCATQRKADIMSELLAFSC